MRMKSPPYYRVLMTYLLEPVGLSESDNAVYLALLAQPAASAAELSARAELPTAGARKALTRLVEAGLATKVPSRPTRFLPAPPQVAMSALIARRRRELQDMCVAAVDLASRMRDSDSSQTAGPVGLVELVEGDEAIQAVGARIQEEAREEVLLVDAPPYLLGTPSRNVGELAALARGVRFRCIYDGSSLEEPGHLDQMTECVRAGEEARTLTAVSMKMQIVDRVVALIPVAFAPAETHTRLLVRASPLLDALVVSFESLWQRAVPVARPAEAPPVTSDRSHGVEPTDRERALLTLLAAGMPDRAIARVLGVPERTLSRHIAELMGVLQASTRFQAGLQAAHLGWLRNADRP